MVIVLLSKEYSFMKKSQFTIITSIILYIIGVGLHFTYFIMSRSYLSNISTLKKHALVLFISFVIFCIGSLVYICGENTSHRRKKAIQMLAISTLVIYITTCMFMLIINRMELGFVDFNFIPFKTVIHYFNAYFDGSINMGTIFINLVGNMILLIPAGILLPIANKKFINILPYTMLVITFLVIVELIQVLTKRGSFDIDDVILNYVGSIIPFVISSFVCNKINLHENKQ